MGYQELRRREAKAREAQSSDGKQSVSSPARRSSLASNSQTKSTSETDELSIDRIVTDSFQDVETEYYKAVRESFRVGFGEVAKVSETRGNIDALTFCGF
jgi:hypothetical protein